jgi:UDPglucose--hexose-1-phosphate uridylyltransferase
MWILPKQHASSFENHQSLIYAGLAKVLKDNLARLDVVLDRPAYNLMIHTSPDRRGNQRALPLAHRDHS